MPGTNLENAVLSTLLLLEDLERLGLVAGGNDTVRDLAVDDLGGRDVDDVRQADEVAERRHAVGAAGAGVGRREGRERLLGVQVLDAEDLGLDLVELDAERGAGGRDVLERGGGREDRVRRRGRELLDERVRVERVEVVDVAGRARED